MLYAIVENRSKVTAKRFLRMFRDIGADIKPASLRYQALFDEEYVAGVFECKEAAFDFSILKRVLEERLNQSSVEMRLSTSALSLEDSNTDVTVRLSDGTEVIASHAFT